VEPLLTYRDLLQLLSRSFLYDLVQRLEMSGYSRALKEELVDGIVNKVPVDVLLPLLGNDVLRELLRAVDQKASGNKDALVERLLDFVENKEDDEEHEQDHEEQEEDDVENEDACPYVDSDQRLAWAFVEVFDKEKLLDIALRRLGDDDVKVRWGSPRIAKEITRYQLDDVLGALHVADLRLINGLLGLDASGAKAELKCTLEAWVTQFEVDDEVEAGDRDDHAHPAVSAKLGVEDDHSHRVKALLIGNENYGGSEQLDNPLKDVRDLSKLLRRLGHEVHEHTDLDHRAMKKALGGFAKGLSPDDKVLVYFSGHGAEVDGENFLFPIGFAVENKADVEYEALAVNRVLKALGRAQFRVVILDACRSNTFKGLARGSRSEGLVPMDLPAPDGTQGTLLCFATAAGTTASDGQPGTNGVYTEALLRHIAAPGRKIEDVMKRVRKDVASATGKKQVPWESSSLTGDWYPAGKRE